MMELKLRPVELFALRALVLDRLQECARPETLVICEWHDIMSDQTVTIEELLMLLLNA